MSQTGIIITDLKMAAPGDGWVVGQQIGHPEDAILYHYQNNRWQRVSIDPALTQGRPLTAITLDAPDDGWAAGAHGLLLRYTHGVWQAG